MRPHSRGVEVRMEPSKRLAARLRERFSGRAQKGLAGAAVLWFVKWAVVVGLMFMGCGPIGPFPGGALDGEVGSAAVADWGVLTM